MASPLAVLLSFRPDNTWCNRLSTTPPSLSDPQAHLQNSGPTRTLHWQSSIGRCVFSRPQIVRNPDLPEEDSCTIHLPEALPEKGNPAPELAYSRPPECFFFVGVFHLNDRCFVRRQFGNGRPRRVSPAMIHQKGSPSAIQKLDQTVTISDPSRSWSSHQIQQAQNEKDT